MRESKANDAARKALLAYMPGSKAYKHNDRGTLGMPDTSFMWNGFTSWLEFKMLRSLTESVHDKFERLQLPECMACERATRNRCWIVAYRLCGKVKTTHIYRPSALRGPSGDVVPTSPLLAPSAGMGERLLEHTFKYGTATLEGLSHNAIAQLVEFTHIGG